MEPFRDLEDRRLCFLESFILWLSKWKKSREGNACVGFLTNDTFNALIHSTKILVEIVKFSLKTLNVEYVLTGKFQTYS